LTVILATLQRLSMWITGSTSCSRSPMMSTLTNM